MMKKRTMRAHYFQHVPFEGPGSIEPWLVSNGFELTGTRFYESAELPQPDAIDFLVIMGGPMSVNEEDTHPWLPLEKQFIRQTIALGKPVLGVCLGAQLIASTMGSGIFPNPVKEIGWFPIHATPDTATASAPIFRFPDSEIVFHWHGETFDLPPDAVRLARSEACENQAFQLGRRVIGLQFHLETTPELANGLVTNCRNELVPSPFVQTADEILSATPDRYASVNNLMDRLLTYLLRDDA